MHQYAKNLTSQNGENGIIEEVFKRLGISKGVAIEFGAPTIEYCSNIHPLILKGWNVVYYDIDPHDERVIKKEITPENVNEIGDCNLLSIDCDGPDASLWQAYNGNPDMVIIEINSSLDPSVDFYHPSKGANYSYMKRLGEAKGYTLICHTGNMLWVRNDHAHLFPDADVTFKRDWLPEGGVVTNDKPYQI